MIRRALVALALASIPVLTGAAVGAWCWREIHRPYRGWEGDGADFELPRGWSAHRTLGELEQAGVLRLAGATRLYLLYQLDDPLLHAGEYRFDRPMTAPEVLDVLVTGRVVAHPVTVIEGLTREEIADALAAAGFGDRGAFLAETSRVELIADLDAEAEDLEGYLFPDTYRFPRGTSERDVIAAMVANFRSKLDLVLEGQPDGAETSVRELVTLASIVEKESLLDSERPLVAGVYAHRLRRGMALGADPTIIFAKKKAGTWDGNLRRPDLRLDDPYNTYVYPGLPPGPICSPGLASLRAAADPADTSYLYFVSRNDGTHVFADTLAEHNRNVDKWQRRYWRERWARERRERD